MGENFDNLPPICKIHQCFIPLIMFYAIIYNIIVLTTTETLVELCCQKYALLNYTSCIHGLFVLTSSCC